MPKKSGFDLAKFKDNRNSLRKHADEWILDSGDLVQAYKAGERDFDGCIIGKCRFEGFNFDGASFQYAKFDYCEFVSCSLIGCNFKYSTHTATFIYECKLDEANLFGAEIDRSKITNCSMKKVNGGSTNWRYVEVYSTIINDANFDDSSFTGFRCTMSQIVRSNFSACHFTFCSFSNSRLISSDFSNSELNSALIEAYIENVNVLSSKGVYIAYGFNLSSRGDALYASIVEEYGKLKLRFWAGCQEELSKKNLMLEIYETYEEEDIQAINYRHAIAFIKAMFDSDMAAKKWDYLLDFDDDIPETTEIEN